LDPFWSLACWSCLPVLLLGAPDLSIPPKRAQMIVAAACAFPLVALAASPIVMIVMFKLGATDHAAHGSLLVRDAERHWRALTNDAPVRYAAGTPQLAWAMTFYGRDKAHAFPDFSR